MATRVSISSFWSLRRDQIEPITLLQSSEEPASSELSAELMIAEINAARNTVRIRGCIPPSTITAMRGST